MNKTISQVFSFLFHPLFVAAYGFSIILFTNNYFSFFFPLRTKLMLLSITFSFTCLLPVFNLFVLKRFKLISSYYLEDGKERTFPYVITAMFYMGMAYLIKDFQIPSIYISFLFAAAIGIILTAIINLKWKISAHLIGLGGLAGSVLALSFILHQNLLMWFCLIVLASGLTAFARIALKAHTPKQVYAGFLVGLLSTFVFIIVAYIINIHNIY